MFFFLILKNILKKQIKNLIIQIRDCANFTKKIIKNEKINKIQFNEFFKKIIVPDITTVLFLKINDKDNFS